MKKAVFLCDGPHIPDVFPPPVREQIAGLVDLYPDVIRSAELEARAAVLQEAQVVFSTWGMPALTEEQIARHLPRLEAVFYAAGSVQAFARPFLARGVMVFSAWAANAVPVIEYASSLIQLSLKGFLPVLSLTKQDWPAAQALAMSYPGAYGGVAVGILGAGMVGRGVLERLRALDVTTWAYDPYCPDDVLAALGARRAQDMETLFRQCQVVSNHVANLPTTREMLRYEHFMALPPRGAFINTGRNSQVHVPGLVRALTERPDLTAFLDVTDPDEPPSPDNPLLACPNLYMTPHMAGSMGLERGRQGQYMAQECARWLAGQPLRWQVTEEMLKTMA